MNNVRATCRLLCCVTAVVLGFSAPRVHGQAFRDSKAAIDVEEAKGQAEIAAAADALQKISRKLLSPADIQADKKPLAKFAADLAKQYEIPIRLDEQVVKDAGVA